MRSEDQSLTLTDPAGRPLLTITAGIDGRSAQALHDLSQAAGQISTRIVIRATTPAVRDPYGEATI